MVGGGMEEKGVSLEFRALTMWERKQPSHPLFLGGGSSAKITQQDKARVGALTSPPNIPFFLLSSRTTALQPYQGSCSPWTPEPGSGPGFFSLLRPLPDYSLPLSPTASLKP